MEKKKKILKKGKKPKGINKYGLNGMCCAEAQPAINSWSRQGFYVAATLEQYPQITARDRSGDREERAFMEEEEK